MEAHARYGGLCQEDRLMPCKGGTRKRGVPCNGLCGPSLLSDVHHCNVVTPMHAHVRAHCTGVRSYVPANWAQPAFDRQPPKPQANGLAPKESLAVLSGKRPRVIAANVARLLRE
jgi:hypothetical protein